MKLYKGALSRTYWLSLKAESVNCAKRSRPFWDFVLLQMKLDISALRILRSLRRKKCPNRVSVSIFRRSKKSLFYVYIYLKKYLYQMYVINMKFNRLFYRWQKGLFENAHNVFNHNNDRQIRKLRYTISTLESQLLNKNEVIAEIMESCIQLKKGVGLQFSIICRSWRDTFRFFRSLFAM